MEKIACNGLKKGQEDLFPINPDLADILGDTDFDFEIFYLLDLFGCQISRFPGSQIFKFPDSQISRRRRRRRRLRRTNSQIPTWPLSQRTQGWNTSARKPSLVKQGLRARRTQNRINSSHWTNKEDKTKYSMFAFFWFMDKLAWSGTKKVSGVVCSY